MACLRKIVQSLILYFIHFPKGLLQTFVLHGNVVLDLTKYNISPVLLGRVRFDKTCPFAVGLHLEPSPL